MEQVQIEGLRTVKRLTDFYNLDAIIAVGYRVNSKKQLNSVYGLRAYCVNIL